MIGELITKQDFSFKVHKRQSVEMNSYFLEQFGRNDFQEVNKRFLG